MSLVRFYTDAITGSLSPAALTQVSSVRPVPEAQPPQPAQPNEDAAYADLSDAAKEYAAAQRVPVGSERAQEAPAPMPAPPAQPLVEENKTEQGEAPSQPAAAGGAESEDAEKKAEEAKQKAAQQVIQELKARDREVRAHEQAHLSALGPYAKGGARFQDQVGPDGQQYAVGGEVSVDVSPEKSPEATIAKAETIRRGALAPAEPSGQDRQVAAQATQMETQARAELSKEQQQKVEEQTKSEGAEEKGTAPETAEPAKAQPQAGGSQPVEGSEQAARPETAGDEDSEDDSESDLAKNLDQSVPVSRYGTLEAARQKTSPGAVLNIMA